MGKMKIINCGLFIFLGILFPLITTAQPADPNDTFVPLDGGLSILLGVAAAYGSHKIKERRKPKG